MNVFKIGEQVNINNIIGIIAGIKTYDQNRYLIVFKDKPSNEMFDKEISTFIESDFKLRKGALNWWYSKYKYYENVYGSEIKKI